ncbi:MAG: transposase [Candidatus Adiutrix intracellularis]|nr:transposase [Candidatus Adiutrix intracellularis]
MLPNYIYIFVRIPLKYSISKIMDYLKGNSSLTIFNRYTNS